jgi:Asp-tRNA(Asn)/Glu-tRNA(Gln) amidotransferase A subunit family amidase
MPMGLQVVGPVNGDHKLVSVAHWIDSALNRL